MGVSVNLRPHLGNPGTPGMRGAGALRLRPAWAECEKSRALQKRMQVQEELCPAMFKGTGRRHRGWGRLCVVCYQLISGQSKQICVWRSETALCAVVGLIQAGGGHTSSPLGRLALSRVDSPRRTSCLRR